METWINLSDCDNSQNEMVIVTVTRMAGVVGISLCNLPKVVQRTTNTQMTGSWAPMDHRCAFGEEGAHDRKVPEHRVHHSLLCMGMCSLIAVRLPVQRNLWYVIVSNRRRCLVVVVVLVPLIWNIHPYPKLIRWQITNTHSSKACTAIWAVQTTDVSVI